MAVLPAGSTGLARVTGRSQPSLSWGINQSTGRIEGTVTGLDAVRQAAEIILSTERFRWQIYQPYSGTEWDGLVGQDPGYVGAELQRRIREALCVDDRITGISGYAYEVDGSKLRASFTVDTVYGSFLEEKEVEL